MFLRRKEVIYFYIPRKPSSSFLSINQPDKSINASGWLLIYTDA
jgi:hypothetical protein